MASNTLLETDVNRGLMTVNALDTKGFPVAAALWLFNSERDSWRFILATPKLDELGRVAAYEALISALEGAAFALRAEDISLVSPKDPLMLQMGTAVRVEGIAQTRVTNSSFNGVYIEDALVYRLNVA